MRFRRHRNLNAGERRASRDAPARAADAAVAADASATRAVDADASPTRADDVDDADSLDGFESSDDSDVESRLSGSSREAADPAAFNATTLFRL